MVVIFVRPPRVRQCLDRLYQEYEIYDTPESEARINLLDMVLERELGKSVQDMTPVFLDLMVTLEEALLKFGYKLDFFSVAGIGLDVNEKSFVLRIK